MAVLALRSITISIKDQQHADNVLRYLTSNPSQHIRSLSFSGAKRSHDCDDRDDWDFHIEPVVTLRQLPCGLSNLELHRLGQQLQPHRPRKGVDSAAARPRLKQLRLKDCKLLGGAKGLAAALSNLPELEHLKVDTLRTGNRSYGFFFTTSTLTQLQQLTYLELAHIYVRGPDKASAPLQPLQALTRLADFRLVGGYTTYNHLVLAGMLSGSHGLTRLSCAWACIEPDVLAGHTRLQRLQLQHCVLHSDHPSRVRVVQLLGHVQELTQLTHLQLQGTLISVEPPAALAYSALTASSRLAVLDISCCVLPVGVWRHIFPAGRQLQQLRSLHISQVREPFAASAAAPEGSRLVSCCPGLQSLDMHGLQCGSEVLGPLQGLSGLRTLLLADPCVGALNDNALAEAGGRGFEAVCQLTGLRELSLQEPDTPEGLLLKLAQLQQLTRLTYMGMLNDSSKMRFFKSNNTVGATAGQACSPLC